MESANEIVEYLSHTRLDLKISVLDHVLGKCWHILIACIQIFYMHM